MIGSQCRRLRRGGAALGVVAGLAAAGFVPSYARAQGYYPGGGRFYGDQHAYPYGGYGPQYGAYYPGGYYAPQAYLAAPPVVYVQPRIRYAAPVHRIVHHAGVRPVAAAAAPCSCALSHPVKPVALARSPTPALPAPMPPAAIAAPPVPSVPSPSAPTFEPRPSAGD